MRVLVTGAVGFIGRHTVRALQHAGHEVLGLDKEPTMDCQLADIMDYYGLDGPPQGGIDRLFKWFKPDAVIHCAAQSCVAVSVQDWAYDAEQNIIGTINVVKACQQYGVKRIVFASSGGTVYGNNPDLPWSEETPVNPVSPYGISKVAGEHYIKISGIPYVILRYPNVYGPGQRSDGESGVVAIWIDRIRRGLKPLIFGDGQKTRDYVYVEDIAEANRLALTGPEGTYNIASGEPISDLDLARRIAEFMDWGGGFELLPDRPNDVQHVELDASKARNFMFLNWHPRYRLEIGIVKTLEADNAIRRTERREPAGECQEVGGEQAQPVGRGLE